MPVPAPLRQGGAPEGHDIGVLEARLLIPGGSPLCLVKVYHLSCKASG